MRVRTCAPNPSDLPVWAVSFRVSDYGTTDAARSVVYDKARSDEFVSAGAYETYLDPEGVNGRLYSQTLPAEGWCQNGKGVYYRLEEPYGRYILTTDLVLDSNVVNDQSEPTAPQYLDLVTKDLLIGSIGSVLDRGNLAQ
jgi:hypothetical protein